MNIHKLTPLCVPLFAKLFVHHLPQFGTLPKLKKHYRISKPDFQITPSGYLCFPSLEMYVTAISVHFHHM